MTIDSSEKYKDITLTAGPTGFNEWIHTGDSIQEHFCAPIVM